MLNQKFRIAIVNVGNNFYYRCSDVFNPFIGPDIEGRIPLKTHVIDHLDRCGCKRFFGE